MISTLSSATSGRPWADGPPRHQQPWIYRRALRSRALYGSRVVGTIAVGRKVGRTGLIKLCRNCVATKRVVHPALLLRDDHLRGAAQRQRDGRGDASDGRERIGNL